MSLNIFLDLDNTIICSEEYSPSAMTTALEYDYDFIHPYITVARPYLQIFLDYIFRNCNVSIWTAGSKNYASFIFNRFIKKYDQNRQLKLLLYKDHCDMSMEATGGLKSLSMLWDVWKIPGFFYNNTIIVDDLREVCNLQPKNCIKVIPFHLKNGQLDSELLQVIEKIKNL